MTLSLTVTLPNCASASVQASGPPFPIIFFFNGFQVSMAARAARMPLAKAAQSCCSVRGADSRSVPLS